MATLTFDAKEVLAQLEASLSAPARRSCFADEMERLMAEGKTESEAAALAFSQLEERVAADVPPALWLVKDDGVYLMTNAPYNPALGVAYAKGLESGGPLTWERARALLGGDDLCEPISAEMFDPDELRTASTVQVSLRMTSTAMTVAVQCAA